MKQKMKQKMKPGTWQKIGVIAAVISSAVAILQPALENLTLKGGQLPTLEAENWPTFLGLMLLLFAIFLGFQIREKQDSLQDIQKGLEQEVDSNKTRIAEIEETLLKVRGALPEKFTEPRSKEPASVAEDGSSQDGS